MTQKNATYCLEAVVNSSSSLVFNCNRITRLNRESATAKFFRVEALNNLILVKQLMSEDDIRKRRGGSPVGTKIFFAFNEKNLLEGGRSIYFHDPNLRRLLRELLGNSVDSPEFDHDLRTIGVLDKLPSLDGFLMQDALDTLGMKPSPAYFDVPDEEKRSINEFIRARFEPIVRRALPHNGFSSSKVSVLLEKIWAASDPDALAPLIAAFRFPEESALEMFSAWKGINFYMFQYASTKADREDFAVWLRDRAMPRNHIPNEDLRNFQALRQTVIKNLRDYWKALDDVARKYNALHAGLVRDEGGASAFVQFLSGVRQVYWDMGNSLSRLSHAVALWRDATRGDRFTKLFSDELEGFFRLLNRLFAPSVQA